MCKKSGARFLAALVCTALIVFSGCPNVTDPAKKPDPAAGPTLVDQVIEELGTALSGPSASARSALAALPADTVDAIKAAARTKIEKDGLSSSVELDKILPSMIEGVKVAVDADTNLGTKASFVFETTARSALSSLGKDDRKTKLSSGIKLEAAVGTIASVTVKVAVESVPEADKAAIVLAVSRVSVQVVAANPVYAPVADVAVKAVVTKSVEKAPGFTAAIVQGSVAGALATGSTLSDDGKKSIVTATVEAAITAGGSDQAAVSLVVTASTTAVVDAIGTDAGSTITTYVLEIAKQVTVTVEEKGIELDSGADVADVITAAVEDADDTIDTSGIADIVTEVTSEKYPALTANSSVAKLITSGPVILTATVTNAGDKTPVYSWVQTSGPTVALSSSTEASVTLTPAVIGEYSFKVTAQFQGGFKKSEASVSFTVAFTDNASAKKVAEGIGFLKTQDFDAALSAFEAAYTLDKSNNEAVFWAAMLKLVSVSVDPDTVSLMKDRIGVARYPSKMNDVFSETWFAPYYHTKWGMVPAADDEDYVYVRGNVVQFVSSSVNNYISVRNVQDNNYESYLGAFEFVPNEQGEWYSDYFVYNEVRYTSQPYSSDQKSIRECGATIFYTDVMKLNPLSSQLLPELKAAPDWASSFLSASNVYGDGVDGKISSSSYFTLLMINLISGNPDGLNTMIDSVLAGPFGERLDSVVSLIDALPDSASVEVPIDLIQAYAGSSFQSEFPITIRKAELKAVSASLQMTKSFIQLIASYNLNYPLAFAKNAFWTDDGAKTAMEALYNQANPVKAGFMGDRSQATRNASKATLLAAMDDMQDAANLFLSDMETDGTIASTYREQLSAEAYAELKNFAGQLKTVSEAVETSLRNNNPLYFNTAAMNGGDLTTLVSATSKDGYLPINFSKLYTTDILNPAKLLESTTEGFKLYTVDVDKSSATALVMMDLPPLPAEGEEYPELMGLWVKVQKARVEEVATIPSGFLEQMPLDSSGNFYIPIGSTEMVDPTMYFIADWMR